MEKKKPHYVLKDIKKLIENESVVIAYKARQTAKNEFYFSRKQILSKLLDLEMNNFYKSMTSYYDVSCWQDVYLYSCKDEEIYIKFCIEEGILKVLSFKKRQS